MLLENKIVKICKIENLEFAKWCILNNVNYLGIHIITEYNYNLDNKNLIKNITLLKGKVILVTKINNFKFLSKIINETHPFGLQLHFKTSYDLISQLQKSFPNLKIFLVITNNTNYEYVRFALNNSFLVIYDSSLIGGTGVDIERTLEKNLSNLDYNKILISGGINNQTILSQKYNKYSGYDIQSFFREKVTKLNYFNKVSQSNQKNLVKSNISLSLTDLVFPIENKYLDYVNLNIFDYHLDYSDSTLYSEFITDNLNIFKKVTKYNNLPLNVHIFSKNNLIPIINEFKNFNQYSITKFFIQYYNEIDLSLARLPGIIFSVYHEDFDDWVNCKIKVNKISIILPKTKEIRIKFMQKLKNSNYLDDKEIWFDRDINLEIIKEIQLFFNDFNVIVGKEVHNLDNLKPIYDQLHSN